MKKLTNDVEIKRMCRTRKQIGKNFLAKKYSKWDFYNFNMKRITHFHFDEVEVVNDLVRGIKTKNGRTCMGLYSETGKELIPMEWSKITLNANYIKCIDFDGGIAIFTYDFTVALPLKKWRYILVDERGIIASIRRDKEYLYDWNGNIIVEKKYSICFLNDDLIRVQDTISDKYALYNASGDELLQKEYSAIEIISDIYCNEYLKVEKSDTDNGLYTLDLKQIIPCNGNNIDYHQLILGEPFKVVNGNEEKIYSLRNGNLKLIKVVS